MGISQALNFFDEIYHLRFDDFLQSTLKLAALTDGQKRASRYKNVFAAPRFMGAELMHQPIGKTFVL